MPGSNSPISDTGARISEAHWIWSGENPGGHLPGRHGVLHHPYGAGQCLLLIPADFLLSAIQTQIPLSPHTRFALLHYLTFPVLNGLTLVYGLLFLCGLGFSLRACCLGVLGLAGLSTFLWYCQNNQENNLMLLCTLAGWRHWMIWMLDEKGKRHNDLVLAALYTGYGILIRIPMAANVIAMIIHWFIHLWMTRGNPFNQRHVCSVALKKCLCYGLPAYGIFIVMDRLYHFWRFGTIQGTYIHLLGDYARTVNPAIPAASPFGNSFWDGFLGPLFSPGKAVWIYDPIIIICFLVLIKSWRSIHPMMKSLLIAIGFLLIITIIGHARYECWSGDAAWGDRFTTLPIHLFALVTVPLWLTYRQFSLPKGIAGFAVAILLIQQVSSLVYPAYFEWVQEDYWAQHIKSGGPPPFLYTSKFTQGRAFYLGMRLENILADATGQFENWQLPRAANAEGKTLGVAQKYLIPFMPLAKVPSLLRYFIYGIWWCDLILVLFLVIPLWEKGITEVE